MSVLQVAAAALPKKGQNPRHLTLNPTLSGGFKARKALLGVAWTSGDVDGIVFVWENMSRHAQGLLNSSNFQGPLWRSAEG